MCMQDNRVVYASLATSYFQLLWAKPWESAMSLLMHYHVTQLYLHGDNMNLKTNNC